mgnify:CR=1 FL=1
MKIRLPQNMWQGSQPIEIQLPDDWDVEIHGIRADELPELTREQLREKLNSPHGLKPLRELAKGRQRVAILFDDISRATPTRQIAELVLEELHAAGIRRDQIRFICALGCHGAHGREEFVRKLGEDIVTRYEVYNHNCYDNLVRVGTASKGYDVLLNREFMSCDLKIGIGAMLPHVFNTFGGGGKIICPGVAGIDTIQKTHTEAINFAREHGIMSAATMGDMRVTAMRAEIEEICAMVGEFFKIDCLFNTRQEIVDLFAGDVVEEYYAAVPTAQEIYRTPRAENKQVIICNANARANEATIGYQLASLACGEGGGEIVVIDHSARGQVTHYMFGTFGQNAPGRMFKSEPNREKLVKRIICYMPHYSATDCYFFGEPEKQVPVKSWEEVMELLKDYGPGTRCSVLVDATMEYFELDQ